MQNFFTNLKRLAPCFIVNDNNINFLKEPIDFYTTLKSKAENSKKRIVFSSLYLGTGCKEKKLIDSITKSIKFNKSNDFRVHLLLDYTRGSRPVENVQNGTKESSRSLCIPMLEADIGERVKVSFYCTPNLRGIWKHVPHKVNEVVGLQHMKIYIIDDCLIMSGANLSDNYFTNRQDRYVVLEDCEELCDYFEELINLIGQHSFTLTINDELRDPAVGIHPQNDNYEEFVSSLRTKITQLINTYISNSSKSQSTNLNKDSTQIYPLIQLGTFGINQDCDVLCEWFNELCKLHKTDTKYKLWLTSGYFNLSQEFEDLLMKLAEVGMDINILTASPQANSFYKGGRVLEYIPDFYSLILIDFLNKIHNLPVAIWEWARPKWTFHAKGIWLSRSNQTNPGRVCTNMTFIGSTNYGERSKSRDLEAELLICSSNDQFQLKMTKESDWLFDKQHTSLVNDKTDSLVQARKWLRFFKRYLKDYL